MRGDVYVDSFGHDGGGGRSGGVDQVCRAIGRVTIIIIILNNTNNKCRFGVVNMESYQPMRK